MFIYVDPEAQIPLTQVHLTLETIRTNPPEPMKKRDELPSSSDRLENAGVDSEVKLVKDTPKEHNQNEREPISLSKALNENSYLMLLGEPGAGKTTTLQFIGLCFAKQYEGWASDHLGMNEDRIPIRLLLQGYANDLEKQHITILNALENMVANRLACTKEIAQELVEEWNNGNHLLVLLDGLDETQNQHENVVSQIRNFVNAPSRKGSRVIVTSRFAGFTSLGDPFKEYTIKPLEKEKELQQFASGWISALRPDYEENKTKAEAHRVIYALRNQSALRRLVNNPLILRLAIQQYIHTGTVARNRAELYDTYVGETWQRAIKRGVKEDKEFVLQVLQTIAWHFQTSGTADEADTKQALINYKITEKESGADSCLRLIREQMGLIALVKERLVFSHTTFREYFVAQRLKQAWEKNHTATWRFLKPLLHIPEWREPLLLLIGLIQEPKSEELLIAQIAKADSTYEFVLQRDILLAANLTAESSVSSDFRNKLYKSIKRRIANARGSGNWNELIKSIGLIGSPKSTTFLIRMLGTDDWRTQSAVRQSLSLIGEAAIPYLKKYIKKETHWRKRYEAVVLLVDMGPTALPTLLELEKDNDSSIREIATSQLRQIYNRGEMSRPRYKFEYSDFSNYLSDSSDMVNRYNEDSYATHKEFIQNERKKDIPNLLIILKSEDSATRSAALHFLGEIFDSTSYDAIFELTNDDDPSVRAEAILALGKLGNHQALPKVIEAIKDDYVNVRLAAVQALEYVGNAKELYLLNPILDEAYPLIRQAAVRIFGLFGDINTLNLLLPVLNDSASEVRDAVADSMERISERLQTQTTSDIRKDIFLLQFIAKELAKRRYYKQLTKMLEKIATLESHASKFQDPLNPPQQPLWQKRLTRLAWGGLVILLLGITSILVIVLTKAQDLLKEKLSLLAQQPIGVLIVIIVTLGATVVVIGWKIDTIREKLKN
jgi:HEAT repeat protein